MRIQARENSKPRTQRSNKGRSRSQMGMTPKLTLPPATGRSRPATGMSQKENMGGAEVWRDSGEQGVTDSARHREEQEWQLEEAEMMRGMQDELQPPATAASGKSGVDDVVDEWALLNELDITAYQIEQERRRREEAEQKYKFKMDLMNQMREKSQSQQLARTMAEQEWKDSKDRLDDWNEQERRRSNKRERRMERRRQMLLRQMEMAQQRKQNEKDRELTEGRQIAAQIREDLHEERERARQEREEAQEEFRLQCEENEMLLQLKRKTDKANENKAVSDLDRYFSKKEAEEQQRQKEIADRYNTCRMRERAHADKVATIDSMSTYHKKTDQELDDEMQEAVDKFDQKEHAAREDRARRKKEGLDMLERQVAEKEHRRRMEFNELLQTVEDMRDAVQEHEEEERHNRVQGHLDKVAYGKALNKQRREDDVRNKSFVVGMTPNERRINLPLLERLREAAEPALNSRPPTQSVGPFSERSRSATPNPAAGQFAKAKKVRDKMRGTTVKFG